MILYVLEYNFTDESGFAKSTTEIYTQMDSINNVISILDAQYGNSGHYKIYKLDNLNQTVVSSK